MSKEIREKINKVRNWNQFLNEGKSKHTTIPVENYKGVLDFIVKDINRLVNLSSYKKDELIKIYGKPYKYKGEFNFYVWDVVYKDLELKIFTNKDKGTVIEVVGSYDERDDKSKSEMIIEFLGELSEKIS
jgi:hypothetical protein